MGGNAPAFGGGGGSRSGGGSGVVGKLKASGKTVTVEFKKQLVKQVQCAQVKYTKRVTQIRPDGTLVYEANCMKNDKPNKWPSEKRVSQMSPNNASCFC